MATFDMTAADGMLKVVTEGPLWDSVVKHSQVIDLFEQNSNVIEGPQGRYVELAQMFGYDEGVGARPAVGGFIPVPGNPTFVDGRVKLKTNYATAQMNYFTMKQASASQAAFADWAEVELTKTERGLRGDLDRQAIGYGSGIICRVSGSPSGVTINIDDPYGLANSTQGWKPGISRGMKLVCGPNADGSALRGGGQPFLVVSINRAGNSGGGALTVDALPAGIADDDYIFRGDENDNAAPHGGVNVEMMGLLGLIDDGTIVPTLQNINRTTYPEWKAQKIDASAAPYSTVPKESLFQQAQDDALEQGGGEITHFLTTLAVYRGLQVEIRKQLGYGASVTSPNTPLGGTARIRIIIGDRVVEVRAMPKMPIGRLFALDSATLQRHHQEGFQWDDTTGSIFRQVGSGGANQDAFWAYGRTIMELSCRDPQKSTFCTGISEAIG